MARPQLENGFARVANEILLALARTRIANRKLRIFVTVLESTYGHKRTLSRLSVSELARRTGIARRHTSALIKELLAERFLVEDHDGGQRLIGPQKDYDQWVGYNADTCTENGTGPENGTPVPLSGNRCTDPRTPYKKDKKVVVVRAREATPTIPEPVRAAVEVHIGPASWNQTIVAAVLRLLERHGEPHVLRAIEEAALRAVPASRFLPYVVRVLDAQAAAGYTWLPRSPSWKSAATPPAPTDPETAWFERQQLYRVLDADLSLGPYFVLTRIRDVGAASGVDVTPYEVLDHDPPPPKAEQRRLVRTFVTAVLHDHPPATTHV